MSGGRWDYAGYRVRTVLDAVAGDESAQKEWPVLCKLLKDLGPMIQRVERELDWFLTGEDKSPKPPEDLMIALLLSAVLKHAPDGWFPRGKWATIQAIQQRGGL